MPTLAETLAQAKACQMAGDLRAAEQFYRRALEVDPAHAEAYYNLSAMAVHQHKFHEATDWLRRLVAVRPDSSDAHNRLAAVLRQQSRLDESEGCCRRALELNPHNVEAHNQLGAILSMQGKLDEAAACYRRALEVNPDFAAAHNNLALILSKQAKLAEAEVCWRRALELKPDFAEAYSNFGVDLWKQRRFDEAAACLRRALELKPDYAEAHNNLGNLLRDQGQLFSAIDAYRRALQGNPRYANAHCNLANALVKCGQTDEALAEFQQALQIAPGNADVIGNYAACLQSQGKLDEAIESYRAAVRINPHNPDHHGNLVYALNYHPGYDALAVFEEHREWARRHADPLSLESAPHANDRAVRRRLRIGYVSGHFRDHAVNFFFEPILAAHDHRAVEVFCYSAALPAECDATTRRLQGHADHWRQIADQSDQQACQTIRADQIDVLVDLSGHIAGNRLLVFARKPAPVQVTYLGYQNTTGMRAMDYRLTDDWSDPPGMTDHLYAERLVRLPRAFFCYLPSADAPPLTPLSSPVKGQVTFGSVNNLAKVTPQVLATWAEILRAIPESRLALLAPVTAGLRQSVRLAFERQGVSGERVELFDRRPRGEYLKLINRVDVALDPFPFNGHTTTCDCLWQGVPVITLAGRTYASRFGGSALVNMGLHELIASTREQYIEIARGLATDVERLTRLRAGLRATMQASPLLDAPTFTRNLEAAYRRMWSDWCMRPNP